EYLKGYQEDKITSYTYSLGTIQKYTHYELTLPNENIAPKIPGNYVLKVYEDGDQSKLVLTRRMYVLSQKIGITAEIVPPNDNSLRETDQKINFTLNYGALRVQNPSAELRTFIMQNARSETGTMNTEPTYINGTQLLFTDPAQNNFAAGNEFRHFDTRSLKLNSERILKIVKDTANAIVMLTDPDLGDTQYSFQYDLDGAFYILNQDGTDPRTDADYAHLFFTLGTKRSPDDGTPYLVGRFNDYRLDENSKMQYDARNNKFAIALFLKQGVYDYTYVWVDKAGKQDDIALEGSHFETENKYQLLVYYRPAGARWEELIGFREVSSARK
ncbi:MAG TPA: type IX secretion system plug protein domain-containing protein, partial [Mucilaginibacter sp.]|nr:type IX secretion system plug protein domain-containing protein [Mucilaginibacter sp.]